MMSVSRFCRFSDDSMYIGVCRCLPCASSGVRAGGARHGLHRMFSQNGLTSDHDQIPLTRHRCTRPGQDVQVAYESSISLHSRLVRNSRERRGLTQPCAFFRIFGQYRTYRFPGLLENLLPFLKTRLQYPSFLSAHFLSFPLPFPEFSNPSPPFRRSSDACAIGANQACRDSALRDKPVRYILHRFFSFSVPPVHQNPHRLHVPIPHP